MPMMDETHNKLKKIVSVTALFIIFFLYKKTTASLNQETVALCYTIKLNVLILIYNSAYNPQKTLSNNINSEIPTDNPLHKAALKRVDVE
jgi:hypothetical protein